VGSKVSDLLPNTHDLRMPVHGILKGTPITGTGRSMNPTSWKLVQLSNVAVLSVHSTPAESESLMAVSEFVKVANGSKCCFINSLHRRYLLARNYKYDLESRY
jgi:hypothetical protein